MLFTRPFCFLDVNVKAGLKLLKSELEFHCY